MVPRPDNDHNMILSAHSHSHDDFFDYQPLDLAKFATTGSVIKRKVSFDDQSSSSASSSKRSCSRSDRDRRSVWFAELETDGHNTHDANHDADTNNGNGTLSGSGACSSYILDDDIKPSLWWSIDETRTRFLEAREAVTMYRKQNQRHLAEYEKLYKICQEPSAIRVMVQNDAIRVSRYHYQNEEEYGCLQGLEAGIFSEVYIANRRAHTQRILAIQQNLTEKTTTMPEYKARIIRGVSLQSSKPMRLLAKLSASGNQKV